MFCHINKDDLSLLRIILIHFTLQFLADVVQKTKKAIKTAVFKKNTLYVKSSATITASIELYRGKVLNFTSQALYSNFEFD